MTAEDARVTPTDADALREQPLAATFESEMVRLGRVVRAARGSQRSIEALAQTAGVSPGLLSQIERGIGNPSYQTLLRICTALGLTPADLVGPAQQPQTERYRVRVSERRRMAWPHEKLVFDVLTPVGQHELTVTRTVMAPGSMGEGWFDPASHRSTICILVIVGFVFLTVDGVPHRLGPGDTLTCRSELIGLMGNDSEIECEYLTISSPGNL